MFKSETTNTYLIVFGLTRPGLDPMIYYTHGEHTNYDTTDRFSSKDKENMKIFDAIDIGHNL